MDTGEHLMLLKDKKERLQLTVVCILGTVAIACVIGIVVLKVLRIETDPTLTAGLCTSLGALTGILVQPVNGNHRHFPPEHPRHFLP